VLPDLIFVLCLPIERRASAGGIATNLQLMTKQADLFSYVFPDLVRQKQRLEWHQSRLKHLPKSVEGNSVS